jgi:hypothetical protein
MQVAGLTETVTVTGETPMVNTQSSTQTFTFSNEVNAPPPARVADAPQRVTIVAPSQNVIDLQRKASGVLPVRVDVPRAGTSHLFVKPLVVDQETVVKLRYKRR